MLKRFISKVVKSELAKEKLNKQFGKQKNYVPLTDLDYEYVKLREKIKWLEHDNITLKDLYEQEKNKNYKTLESEELKQENIKLKELYSKEKLEKNKLLFNSYGEKYEIDLLKQENEKLKKENEQLKNLSCTIVVGNDGKLDSLFNQKLKSENEKLKKQLLDSKNGLNGANDIIKNMKQENQKLKEANSDLTEKLFRIESVTNYYENINPDYYTLVEFLKSIKTLSKKVR